jgi:hypothetical protein
VRGSRPGRQQLAEEVTPGQLADERLAARQAREFGGHGARGQAAEVQVGRQPGGRVGGEVVACAVVAGQVPAGPAREPPQAGSFAAGRRSWRWPGAGQAGERWEGAGADPARHGDVLGRSRFPAARLGEPAPVVGGEDLIGRTGLTRAPARRVIAPGAVTMTPGCVMTSRLAWALSVSSWFMRRLAYPETSCAR